eukprot:scaffold7518_cov267-Pinguiococcus_pyrenoidosus.AAC.1
MSFVERCDVTLWAGNPTNSLASLSRLARCPRPGHPTLGGCRTAFGAQRVWICAELESAVPLHSAFARAPKP